MQSYSVCTGRIAVATEDVDMQSIWLYVMLFADKTLIWQNNVTLYALQLYVNFQQASVSVHSDSTIKGYWTD